jgi:myosin heavy subunit
MAGKASETGRKQQEMEEMIKQLQKKLEGVEERCTKLEKVEDKCKSLKEENAKLKEKLSELQGEQKKVATHTAVVTAKMEKVQAWQEKHDKVMRESNILVTGIEDLKEETETEAKAKVEEVLQKGLRLAPSGSGSVEHAVQLERFTDGKRPRPILVKCKSSSSAGEILRSRSSLTDSEFAGVYLNPDRTPEERVRVSQAVREMTKLKNKDSSVQAFVAMQGVLVVQSEKGQQERRVFESASPWAAEATAASAAMRSEGTWVQVTRRGVRRRTAEERASTPSSQA